MLIIKEINYEFFSLYIHIFVKVRSIVELVKLDSRNNRNNSNRNTEHGK
jgi:hypothetical protein